MRAEDGNGTEEGWVMAILSDALQPVGEIVLENVDGGDATKHRENEGEKA